MKIVLFVLLLFWFGSDETKAGPISSRDIDESSNSVEEDESVDDIAVLEDDDFTTHGLERLSSAATCLVAGVEYTHGQQIYRADPCEFCLCLDGEMFCWWQDCPPTMEGPCRDRGPFSPCITVPTNKKAPQKPVKLSNTDAPTNSDLPRSESPPATHQTSSITSTEAETDSSQSLEDTTSSASTRESDTSTVMINSSSTTVAPKCIILGKEYNIGEPLPHTTGNCLECICGQGANITCSPHQCVPIDDDDMDEYRPPGNSPQDQDIF